MKLHIYKNAEETCNALADWITELINKTLEVKEKFILALPGGETPKILFQILASEAYREKIYWSRIHIFWGDERFVPFTDKSNNAKMAYDNLLDHVPVPSSQIHKIRTDITPPASVMDYEKILHQYFDNTRSTFDLILLGMGDDGHTLSLFPGSEILHDRSSWVSSVNLKEKGERITLMPNIVNKSTEIVFLITGEKKANVLKEIFENPQLKKYPVQLIQPENGELHWFLDDESAKCLNQLKSF